MVFSRKTFFFLALAIAISLGIACFLRITYVNTHAPQIVTENYLEDDWVDLEGSFAGLASENTDGLSLTVESSRIESPRQFLETHSDTRYNFNEDIVGKYDDIRAADADTPSILVVHLVIRRSRENIDGYFAAIDWRVISLKNPSLSMQPDWDLWEAADHKMIDQSSFQIGANTEFAMDVPFSIQAEQQYFDTKSLRSRLPLESGKYRFVITNSPIRKTITFSSGYGA